MGKGNRKRGKSSRLSGAEEKAPGGRRSRRGGGTAAERGKSSRLGGAEEKAPGGRRSRRVAGAAADRPGSDPLAFSRDTEESETLPLDEQRFLRMISLDAASGNGIDPDDLVARAVDILEQYHMVILHGVLDDGEIATLHADYQHFLDFSGDAAIGEKDASKRSGTRLYNCACQVGPACKFRGWKDGSEGSKHVLHAKPCKANGWNGKPRVWERIVNHFDFNTLLESRWSRAIRDVETRVGTQMESAG